MMVDKTVAEGIFVERRPERKGRGPAEIGRPDRDGSMTSRLYPIKALFAGLIVTQIMAAIFVYGADLDLYEQTEALTRMGYLVVPNRHVAPTLTQWGPALAGGLFFTFSLGAGLSALSLGAAWVHLRVAAGRRSGYVALIAALAALVAAANWRGFNGLLTALLVTVPPIVYALSRRWMPKGPVRFGPVHVAFIIPILILGAVWGSMKDDHLFLDVRDYLLWSNPPGRALTDFYYQYTLYPAEAFKSLKQKTLRSVGWKVEGDHPMAIDLKMRLAQYDYLPVLPDDPADLTAEVSGEDLVFMRDDRLLATTPLDSFLADPRLDLELVSRAADRNRNLRRAVFLSILMGLPVFLYLVIFSLSHYAAGLFLPKGESAAAIMAAIVCLALGLGLLGPLIYGRSAGGGDPAGLLNSPSWWRRTAGLKAVVAGNLDIGAVTDYGPLLTSPHPAERYWLAKALGTSRSPRADRDLVALLDDPNPNVRCLAFHSIGTRRNPAPLSTVIRRIEASRHWYVQWYAYRALRNLGWSQNPSN